MRHLLLCVCVLLICPTIAKSTEPDLKLTTLAEQSQWKRTGRYDEVNRLCKEFEAAFPAEVRAFQFGETADGRPMMAIAASADGVLYAKAAKTRNRPIVLVQGGIHAGEIDGKDAGFLLLRELLEGRIEPGLLSKLTFVFVPVFNIDGHERFGKNNRPNQRGPEEMGWRSTAQNYNLNRDYTKADAPEMVAMLKLLHQWDPILYVDLHVTDGGDFQYDVSLTVSPSLKGPEALTRAGKRLAERAKKDLEEKGHLPLLFYPQYVKEDEPLSGFATWVPGARYSEGYWELNNRIGVLVETHSWKDYATRVKATHDTVAALMKVAAEEADEWRRAAKQADEEGRAIGGKDVVLKYEATKKAEMIDFKGYKFERKLSPISGLTYTKYDPSVPEIWKVPFFSDLQPSVTITAPKGGYLVPKAHAAWMSEKLKLHGIEYQVLPAAIAMDAEAFRSKDFKFAPQSYEGHQVLTLKGNWTTERRELPAGSLFVPIAQPRARLVMQLFEPVSSESYLAWGFFNTAFEKKEYLERYVGEEVVQKMLKDNPGLEAEFQAMLKEHPEVANSAEKKLEFFYRRHPTWDERYGLYPVLRTDKAP
jgi:hypothetical protein